jgi:glycosyltransferase involved in cell wall biosynthesis
MALVSVIIPTYNRRAILPAAIRSVLNQTFGNLELIVVDDASDESSEDVVKGFKDTRVRLIRHGSRAGGAAARNTGIRNSHGDYVAFLDDDDEWYPEKLAMQMSVMSKSGPEVGAIYTGYLVVDRATGKVCLQRVPTRRGDLCSILLKSNPIGTTSSILLKRTCLERVGYFDDTLPSFQDRDLWIRISREFHFDYVSEPLLNYFVHSKKVWTNPDALIKGLEIMLSKYGSSPDFRKECSRRYMEFGVRFGQEKQLQKARQALLKSLGLYPYGIRAYLYLCLTILGSGAFLITREAKARIVHS